MLIVFTLFGIETSVSDVQPSNAEYPINVGPLFITTFLSFVQFSKAPSSIILTDDGIVMLSNEEHP